MNKPRIGVTYRFRHKKMELNEFEPIIGKQKLFRLLDMIRIQRALCRRRLHFLGCGSPSMTPREFPNMKKAFCSQIGCRSLSNTVLACSFKDSRAQSLSVSISCGGRPENEEAHNSELPSERVPHMRNEHKVLFAHQLCTFRVLIFNISGFLSIEFVGPPPQIIVIHPNLRLEKRQKICSKCI